VNGDQDPTIREIDRWFFGEYLSKWVSIGASGSDDLSEILHYWGVPMHAASVHMNQWLLTPEAVMGLLAANYAPLKATGYSHTAVLDAAIRAYNDNAASVDVIWSRRRADGSEIERIAGHFEIHRTDQGWRVISLASKATTETSLSEAWPPAARPTAATS
jgi:hypothetical protein